MAEKVAIQLKDKALICDDLALKAQLFVIMADFESARRYLLKAYKQKTPVASDRERIEIDLKSGILVTLQFLKRLYLILSPLFNSGSAVQVTRSLLCCVIRRGG